MKSENNGELDACGTTGSMLLMNVKKQKKDTIGIYKIVNKVNEKYYVGSTINLNLRWNQHKQKLRKQIHINPHLQSAWNKYGNDSFVYIIVETSDMSNLLLTEQKYLDIAKKEPDKCYNISFDAFCPNRGRKLRPRTEKEKERIRQTLSGQKHTQERIDNIKKSLVGKMDGEKNGFFGKHHKEKTKLKYKENSNRFWLELKSDSVKYALWRKNVSEKTKLGKSNKT